MTMYLYLFLFNLNKLQGTNAYACRNKLMSVYGRLNNILVHCLFQFSLDHSDVWVYSPQTLDRFLQENISPFEWRWSTCRNQKIKDVFVVVSENNWVPCFNSNKRWYFTRFIWKYCILNQGHPRCLIQLA